MLISSRWHALWLGLTIAACGSGDAPSGAPAQQPGAAAPSAPSQPASPVATPPGTQAGPAARPGNSPASPTTNTPSSMNPSGAAGAGAPAANPGATPSANPNPQPDANGHINYPDLRGGCGIQTQFPDDHACILPPAPGEGIQVHIGPKNYDDPADVARFLLQPGEENSQCWTYQTSNEQDAFYQTYVMSGRAGTHHILGSMLSGNVVPDQGFTRCADTREDSESGIMNLGPMPMATKPYMPRGQVAPENKNIAHRLPARAFGEADMHYYNFTDKPILRELWINLYFVPPEQVTGEMVRIRGMGGFGWSRMPIAPGTDMVYQYECPVSGKGRILSLLGHYHAHGKRFSASVKRTSGEVQKVFEMYDYQDPAGFEYDSVSVNPMFSASAAGAVTGLLEVNEGDILAWECHIINDSDVGLKYTNEVNTGEMCNLWGQSYGIAQWDCLKN
jgi:hypothetical protein